MIYLSFFLTMTLFIYGIIKTRSESKEKVQKRLAIFVTAEKNKDSGHIAVEQDRSFFHRFISPLINDFKRSFKKRMPGEKEAKIERKLQLAGSPFGMTAVDFRLFQTALFLLLPLLFGAYAALLNTGMGGVIVLVLLGTIMGASIPHIYLRQKMKIRNHYALRELPDVLDLLTVSLEAGLGFDSAISKVVAKKDGVISNEFHRCLEEIRLGKTRRESLAGIRERLEVDEMKAFISSILQAEKLGIGMVQVLRVQSNEVRDRRKQRAEEEAMKAPIKMLFPLVLFIFPSLFIVLLGPAVIQFLQTFQK